MKRSYLCLILALGYHLASAQFPSIPDSNAIWFEETTLGPDPLFSSGFYLEPFDHDSLINDTLFSLLGSGFYQPQVAPPFYCGGIFDDFLGHVYFRDFSSDRTYLLYDFSLVIGDSAYVCVAEGCGSISFPVKMFVQSVDTLIIHGDPFRRIQILNAIGSGGLHYWIQRVGGTGGLLSTIGTLTVSTETRITCMSYNDTIWYQGSVSNCLFTAMRPNDDPDQHLPFFHPTLAHDKLVIDIPTTKARVELLSMDGRVLHTVLPPNGIVSLDGLAPGNYVLRMVDGNGNARHGRFLKE